jgi:hypothetical protein
MIPQTLLSNSFACNHVSIRLGTKVRGSNSRITHTRRGSGGSLSKRAISKRTTVRFCYRRCLLNIIRIKNWEKAPRAIWPSTCTAYTAKGSISSHRRGANRWNSLKFGLYWHLCWNFIKENIARSLKSTTEIVQQNRAVLSSIEESVYSTMDLWSTPWELEEWAYACTMLLFEELRPLQEDVGEGVAGRRVLWNHPCLLEIYIYGRRLSCYRICASWWQQFPIVGFAGGRRSGRGWRRLDRTHAARLASGADHAVSPPGRPTPRARTNPRSSPPF